MPAAKEPRRKQRGDKIFIWPGPGDRGGVEVIPELVKAWQQAVHEANYLDRNRYVVRVEGGYVVMGYASIWDYFGDSMKEETIYEIEAPGTSKSKKGETNAAN